MQPAAPGSSDAWCPAPSELTMPRCQARGGDGPRARTSITPRVRAPKRRHSHCLPGVGFSRCQNRPRSRSPIISGRLRRSPRQLRLPPALPAAPHAPHSRGCSAARSPQCRAASTPSPRFPRRAVFPLPQHGAQQLRLPPRSRGVDFFFFFKRQWVRAAEQPVLGAPAANLPGRDGLGAPLTSQRCRAAAQPQEQQQLQARGAAAPLSPSAHAGPLRSFPDQS